jgi:hypothetical protein
MRNIEKEVMKNGSTFSYPVGDIVEKVYHTLARKTFDKFSMDNVSNISWGISEIILIKHEKNNL